MKPTKKHLVVAGTMLLLGIALGIAVVQAAGATRPPSVLPPARILYLAPAVLPTAEDVPGSKAALQAEGVTVFHDFGVLKQATTQDKPDAVILHQQSLPQVDKGWIAKQYHSGIVIAAINVKMRDLADLVGDSRILESPWTDNWYKKPFYSYVGIKVTLMPSGEPSRETVAHGTNNINDQEGNLKRFLYALRLAVKAFESKP